MSSNSIKNTLLYGLLGAAVTTILFRNTASGQPYPVPAPNPTPSPTPTPTGKLTMLEFLNWQSTTSTGQDPVAALRVANLHEVSDFVYLVSNTGAVLGGSSTMTLNMKAKVQAGGKKATFTIGGGTQNVSDITTAMTTNSSALINSIASRIQNEGWDGVKLDIENTNISSSAMVNFINNLRFKLNQIKPGLIISLNIQPYARTTVYAGLSQAEPSITTIYPMIYDFAYTVTDIQNIANDFVTRMNGKASKVFPEVAVAPDMNGRFLSTTEFSQVLDLCYSQGWGGVGIWDSFAMTDPYWNLLASKGFS